MSQKHILDLWRAAFPVLNRLCATMTPTTDNDKNKMEARDAHKKIEYAEFAVVHIACVTLLELESQ